jgi:signal transduction histidine kinase
MNTDEKVFYGVLQVASVLNSQNQFLETLLSVLILLTVIVILIGATLGLFLARKALKPIDQVIAATERIEKGDDLANRIDYTGPSDEIGRLTQKINSMLARLQSAYTELEESYSAQRRFVSDASHELRTPLTTIRGNVDLLERMWAKSNVELPTLLESANLEMTREAMQDIAGEAARMSRLINDLLSLARADAGVEMDKDWVSMEPIVQQVVRRATLLPKSVDWQVGDLSALQGSSVYGNEDYLQQLLFIFIENAFNYTDKGYVRIEALRDNDQIGIKIMDTGIGMDKEEVPHIFERFYRADLSRGKKTGTGLGLSIAKWIIDKHGGSIEVKTRLHEGTTFMIWLPASFLPSSD